ncbi:MAG: multicopper oxidase domain-containing protein [Ilumatobacteraceae bacterium]
MSAEDRSVLNWVTLAAALAALVVAIIGVRDGGESAAGASGSGDGAKPTVDVFMGDLYFRPETVVIPPQGAIIHLVNEGAAAHNMEIPELGLVSPVVQGGQMFDWEIGPLAEGTYEFQCPQPGHAQAGMVGTLTVSATEEPTSSGGTDTNSGNFHGFVDWSAMDAAMLARANAFPAATSAHGGDLLEYSMVDGWKVFEVEAKIVDWEVEPGKWVEGWTYNGVIPAPTIKVFSGDKVRIIVTNNLPMSHSMHFHGIDVPNVMDGVDPYTEPPAKPGEVRVYEFVAKGPAVGIYHPHHGADLQIPNGMFGAFLIDDIPTPQKLIDKGYPATPTKTVNMVLNDAGTIGLSLNGKSFPATVPYTLRVGETMLVHYFNEGLMPHPMHLHQPTGWIIAKDGVPLDEPWPTDTVNVAPGERYSVLYRGGTTGVWAWHCHILTHAETPEGLRYMVTALIVER